MKLTVVTDKAGNIVATMHAPAGHQRVKDAPTEVEVVPQASERRHEVEVPDHLARGEGLHQLHTHYRLKVTKSKVELVTRRSRSGRTKS